MRFLILLLTIFYTVTSKNISSADFKRLDQFENLIYKTCPYKSTINCLKPILHKDFGFGLGKDGLLSRGRFLTYHANKTFRALVIDRTSLEHNTYDGSLFASTQESSPVHGHYEIKPEVPNGKDLLVKLAIYARTEF
ncbi:unnamed protein product [Caenorhabditis angaria]|uniref:Uncharacterized protein n=1 Tax=Caenorhabditis angaria TaxID=860376 RepID=A0A9P1I956_9PELO|nr:unnamed protein product [Caenorhabditis angaria]